MSKDKSKKWVISAPLFYNYAEFLGINLEFIRMNLEFLRINLEFLEIASLRSQ
ncbi:MAG: hypothetical protein MR469_08585 [Campylobacter sp.]|uniref:hypothetical protein n=1 Tax=Campylobacter sp. TaxID=205 RepID=UPI002AA86CA9|nr:hypothetical protein [Campylobacter sp.]MCI6695674.1 hypothetical protein [Campylobacter sp.]